MHGFQPSNILQYILPNFHFEKPKTLRMPPMSQTQGLIEITEGNGNVGFVFTDVCAPPQLPHGNIRRVAVGVETGGFQSTTRSGMGRCLLEECSSNVFVVGG